MAEPVEDEASISAYSTFRPARQLRLYEDVAKQLREAILTRVYSPGDRLPTEPQLMRQFGVSRAVVRQATLLLEHEGLVSMQVGAGGGAFVQRSGVDPVLRAFENLCRHEAVTLHDYLAAKRLLEPVMVQAINASTDHQERLRANVDRFQQQIAGDASEVALLRTTLEFHEILIEAIGNPVLEAVLLAVVRLGERVPAFMMTPRGDWQHILEDHRQIAESLLTPRFAKLMAEHFESVADIYGGTP